mgnify:FL=1|jgi:hypothetical protein
MPHIPKLDLFLHVTTPHLEQLAHSLGKQIDLQDRHQKKGLRMLLCNLYVHGKNKVVVSRRIQSLGGVKYNPLNIECGAINNSLDKLKIAGYIVQVIGNPSEGTMTTMESTDKLIQWFKDTGWSDNSIDKTVGSYISLREARKQNGRTVYVDFKDTKYSKWLGERVRQYDQLLNGCRIALLNDDGSENKVFKKFTVQREFIEQQSTHENMEFAFGGKITAPWTNLSSKFKENVTINGEPTIEIDIDATNLNAMYQVITGAAYPHKDDPYLITVDDVVVPMHIVKSFTTFMQSSKTPKGAAHSVLNFYKKKALEVKNPKEEDVKKYDEYIEFKRNTKPTDIAQAILDKHSLVISHFNKGNTYGDFISCWGSDIAFEVIMELTKKEIPCLVTDDSFIVPAQHKDLVNEMKNSTAYVDRRDIKEALK